MSNRERLVAGALALAITFLASGAARAKPASAVAPNAVSCILIKTAAQLQAMNSNLAASYCLANDIDLSAVANFVPVGSSATPFTGNFFGNNHVISNLKINSAADFVGLFGLVQGAIFRDVTLQNVKITASETSANTGGLIGFGSSAVAFTLDNLHVSGVVKCTGASCTAGGLVGDLEASYTVTGSSSSANVFAMSIAGGLVGFYNGTIENSFATGAVSCAASGSAGGLVGRGSGTVTRSFATGSVTGGASVVVGGLAAVTFSSTSFSFATGAVTGGASAKVGGLIANAVGGANVNDQCYAVGAVSGGAGASVGGLIGVAVGATATNSYWDTTTTGQATSSRRWHRERRPRNCARRCPRASIQPRWAITKRAQLSVPQ